MLSHIETDTCVLCGEDTGVPTHMPIMLRPHYIEASGQLCLKCYRELYSTETVLLAKGS